MLALGVKLFRGSVYGQETLLFKVDIGLFKEYFELYMNISYSFFSVYFQTFSDFVSLLAHALYLDGLMLTFGC